MGFLHLESTDSFLNPFVHLTKDKTLVEMVELNTKDERKPEKKLGYINGVSNSLASDCIFHT